MRTSPRSERVCKSCISSAESEEGQQSEGQHHGQVALEWAELQCMTWGVQCSRDLDHVLGRVVVVAIGVEVAAAAEVSIFVSFRKHLVFKSRSSSPNM